MEEILCKKHNVAKVPMRNKRKAPMLGCPICHGTAPESSPTPAPAPQPKPERKSSSFQTFYRRAMEG